MVAVGGFLVAATLGVSTLSSKPTGESRLLSVDASYNSVFYTSLANNEYGILVVNERFPNPDVYVPVKSTYRSMYGYGEGADPIPILKNMTAEHANVERLDNAKCINTYAQDFLSDRSNLILLTDGLGEQCQNASGANDIPVNCSSLQEYEDIPLDAPTGNGLHIYTWLYGAGPYDYVESSDLNNLKRNPGNWTVFGHRINGCISQRVEPRCRLNFSLPLGVTVVVFNLFKSGCITLVFLFLRDQPLITVGDAVASFLRSPDPSTAGLCLASAKEVQETWGKRIPPPAKECVPESRRYSEGAGRKVWIIWGIW